MPNFLKTCRICGKQYETCRTLHPILGHDRWQDVACCPEHGAQWFAAIYASRSGEAVAEGGEVAQEAQTEVVEASEDNGDTEVKAKQPRRKKNDNDVTE